VEGYALARGFEIALSCDLIVAAEETKFGVPVVKRGLVASSGGLVKPPRQIPPRIAEELALTGEFIDTHRAYNLGLINQVVANGEVLAVAVAASKMVIDRTLDWKLASIFPEQKKTLTQSSLAKMRLRALNLLPRDERLFGRRNRSASGGELRCHCPCRTCALASTSQPPGNNTR